MRATPGCAVLRRTDSRRVRADDKHAPCNRFVRGRPAGCCRARRAVAPSTPTPVVRLGTCNGDDGSDRVDREALHRVVWVGHSVGHSGAGSSADRADLQRGGGRDIVAERLCYASTETGKALSRRGRYHVVARSRPGAARAGRQAAGEPELAQSPARRWTRLGAVVRASSPPPRPRRAGPVPETAANQPSRGPCRAARPRPRTQRRRS